VNPYVFVNNNALSTYDVQGLWGSDVHLGRTEQWARDLGIEPDSTVRIGVWDDGVDTQYSVYNFDDSNWGWHFNRSMSGDSRLEHRDAQLRKAKQECTNPTDDALWAAEDLGIALHPLQDWVAHGDFNRKAEEPNLTGFPKAVYWHNFVALWYTAGLYGPGDPDNPEMDANGL
jgi:hypothetical protein